MAKIVELEKQLMQRNKELDVIRVSVMGKLWLGAMFQGRGLVCILCLGGNGCRNGLSNFCWPSNFERSPDLK